MPKKSARVENNFPFYQHLLAFYRENRGRIRQHYRELSRKYLDYNSPDNAHAFLRQPQFEALEMYVFLKEFLHNAPMHQIFKDWSESTGLFEGRGVVATFSAGGQVAQRGLFEMETRETYDLVYNVLKAYARDYPNYIFALTMGTGKTILIATCIFYEFILANKFPADRKYCHNALVFAPDTTVLQSLREIQTFDKSRVVPPEYVHWLDANIRFHFLDEAGMTLDVLDRSRFNLIISNTQKVILKRQHKTKSPMDLLMQSRPIVASPGSVYERLQAIYSESELETPDDLTSNQRFQKLQRLAQLGIYVDEAHHAFGQKLADDMAVVASEDENTTSLRLTIDRLSKSLRAAGSHVVACYNYTGTPYVQNTILPEVVYAFGLNEAIQKRFLKKVRIHGYENTRTQEFVEQAIKDFCEHNKLDERHEGLLPKMAFFAATIDELHNELFPAVESALLERGISTDKILINVGDDRLTRNEDIREFNRLDTPDSQKQFILLVNKGREGWNCRSLFGVALYRKPKSKIFVLQATMRCLRAIGEVQQTGQVYLSKENMAILDDELKENFRVTVQELEEKGSTAQALQVHVRQPVEKVRVMRVRNLFQLVRKPLPTQIDLEMAYVQTDNYHMIHEMREGFSADRHMTRIEDISALRKRRTFSPYTLVAEIARYLNLPCLEIESLLTNSVSGMEAIVARVNEFNEILYDHIIPHLFNELYAIKEFTAEESQEIELVRVPERGYYTFSAKPETTSREREHPAHAGKSFHLDAYSFDSNSEYQFFEKMLPDSQVSKIFFTGMLTHGQSDFFIQYIDPESHTVRSYYPDFLIQDTQGQYFILEVKRDDQIDVPVVRAKKTFAEKTAAASNMRYVLLKASDAEHGRYQMIWQPADRRRYFDELMKESEQRDVQGES
jgi:type III restriction enzyme